MQVEYIRDASFERIWDNLFRSKAAFKRVRFQDTNGHKHTYLTPVPEEVQKMYRGQSTKAIFEIKSAVIRLYAGSHAEVSYVNYDDCKLALRIMGQ